jgi:hypothetical protein
VFSQGNPSNGNKKYENQAKIDPFGKLGEQLTWQNPVKRVKYYLDHN